MARESYNTNILRGYFDTKVYNGSKPREQWATKGQEETISFGVTFDELPEAFREFAKPYTSQRDGKERYRVTFKISKNCRWKDGEGHDLTARPQHDTLEGKQFDAVINYGVLHGDPTKKEASGYWANGIIFKEVETDPLAGITLVQQPATPVAEPAVAEPEQGDSSDELDF